MFEIGYYVIELCAVIDFNPLIFKEACAFKLFMSQKRNKTKQKEPIKYLKLNQSDSTRVKLISLTRDIITYRTITDDRIYFRKFNNFLSVSQQLIKGFVLRNF
jgi:hypothetical protein